MTDERIEGLGRQLKALDEKIARGDFLGGWKVGLTSGRARNSMGEDFRPFGYILSSRIFKSGVVVELESIGRTGVENELCFKMGETLTGDVSREEVIRAVASVAPGFEINQRRLEASAPAGDRLADDLSQWGIVMGTSRPIESVAFDDILVSLTRDGELVETVPARGHIDDHFDSIARLTAQLSRFGRVLERDACVITGSFTRQGVPSPSRWLGNFSPCLGTVEVVFS
jgi:2-keto-4-pentenoate hydratase